MSPTTIKIIEYIKYIQDNKKYIKIAVEKYNEKLDTQVIDINNFLGCNILSANLEDLANKIEKLQGVDYIDITEKIEKLGESISAVILEERHPIINKMNETSEEER